MRPGLFRDDRRARPVDLSLAGGVSLHSLYTIRRLDATRRFDRSGPDHGRTINRVQRRQFLHGSCPLTWLACRGELAADVGARLVDRAMAIGIEKTAGLVKGQGMEPVSPPRRLPARPASESRWRSGDRGPHRPKRQRSGKRRKRAAAFAFVTCREWLRHRARPMRRVSAAINPGRAP